LHQNG